MSHQLSDGEIAWRLQQVESRVQRIESELEERFARVERKIDRNTTALLTFALTLAGSVFVWALTHMSAT